MLEPSRHSQLFLHPSSFPPLFPSCLVLVPLPFGSFLLPFPFLTFSCLRTPTPISLWFLSCPWSRKADWGPGKKGKGIKGRPEQAGLGLKAPCLGFLWPGYMHSMPLGTNSGFPCLLYKRGHTTSDSSYPLRGSLSWSKCMNH